MPVVLPNRPQTFLARTPVASAVLLALASPALMAQDTSVARRSDRHRAEAPESLQDVPISIDALGEKKMEELNVQNFKDYVQFLPTVTMQPSTAQVPASTPCTCAASRPAATARRRPRSRASACTSTSSRSRRSRATSTSTCTTSRASRRSRARRARCTARARRQARSASSPTSRTRPASPRASRSRATTSTWTTPATSRKASSTCRSARTPRCASSAGSSDDAGWVDNKPATRPTMATSRPPADDFVTNNDGFVREQLQHGRDIRRARGVARQSGRELDHHPARSCTRGRTSRAPGATTSRTSSADGDHTVAHFRPEFTDDEWYQAGLTVEGSIANFDVVYSGNYLDRDVDGSFDYSDYSYWYDNTVHDRLLHGPLLRQRRQPDQSGCRFSNDDHYTKMSHEIRISTPQDKRVRGLLGFFYQKQYHDFYQEFGRIDEPRRTSMVMNSGEPRLAHFPGVVYLNSMDRDRHATRPCSPRSRSTSRTSSSSRSAGATSSRRCTSRDSSGSASA